jgi:putative tricarboxylic transport membrane protein
LTDTLNLLLNGFAVALTPGNLLACFVGVLMGTITGILPGLGPIGAMALLMSATFGMPTSTALIMLAGIYYGAYYGGSTTSILMNLPGEAASVMTCLDGYAMAKKGRAGAALAIAAIGSFLAGTVGLVLLMLFSPPLAKAALSFGPPEYFSLAVLGLFLLSNITGKSVLESTLMSLVGMAIGTIGTDVVSGSSRFTMGITELTTGIDFPLIAMGAFGVAEVLSVITEKGQEGIQLQNVRFRDLYPSKEELRRSAMPMARGSVLGFLVGLIPGPAASLSSFFSYALEKKISKRPQEFGNGAVEGVAGPESANNAATAGAMTPLLALGLAFSPGTAMLMAGLMIHGVTPGPLFIKDHAPLFWGLIASMYVGNVLLLVLNLPMVGVFASILKTPINILMPLILVITLTGTYAINLQLLDLALVVLFGVMGFYLRRAGLDVAPLAVGVVIGPMLESTWRQTLLMGNGNLAYPLERPISGVILGLLGLGVVISFAHKIILYMKGRRVTAGEVG